MPADEDNFERKFKRNIATISKILNICDEDKCMSDESYESKQKGDF
ncbi:MAG: hypothetical protein IJB12_04800 [Methanocorpusculum sp.]|nr:hypothetical protein [Methanocorpusculum sp.]